MFTIPNKYGPDYAEEYVLVQIGYAMWPVW